MNADEIIQKNLQKVDIAWADFLKLLEDPTHLNQKSTEMNEARTSVGEAINELFAAKNVIHNAKK